MSVFFVHPTLPTARSPVPASGITLLQSNGHKKREILNSASSTSYRMVSVCSPLVPLARRRGLAAAAAAFDAGLHTPVLAGEMV